MKILTLAFTSLFAFGGFLAAHCPVHELADTQKKAATEKKYVLLAFLGGDWHEASQKLRNEVFADETFRKKIESKFVTQECEIPKDQSKIEQGLADLRKKFYARGLPTLIMMDSLGRPFGYSGAPRGGVEAMTQKFDQVLELVEKRDAAFAEAAKAEGVPRAEAYVKALRLLPSQVVKDFYQAELAEIKKADPNDETKLVGEFAAAEALKKEQDYYNALFGAKKYDQVIEESQAAAKEQKGEEAQRLSMYAIQAMVNQEEFEAASKAIEAMAKLAPATRYGQSAERYQKTVAQIKERKENPQKSQRVPANPQPRPKTGPIVSKPVAVVSDPKALEDDLNKLDEELAAISQKATEATKMEAESKKRISELEQELKELKAKQPTQSEAAEEARSEQLRLTKKRKMLQEVIENHQAMEKRKKEFLEREKRAAELRQEAEKKQKGD